MSGSDERMGVAVIGVGRMGARHARTYKRVAGARLVAVVDRDLERAATLADELGCAAFGDVAELLGKFPEIKAVTVAVPTRDHAVVAGPLLARGIGCLIEKPLAPTAAEARRLCEQAREHGAVLQVGHTERFNPAVRAVSRMNITPRFMEVQRVSPMTFRSLDVGVVMDMMIHDLDIVLMLARSRIAKVDATGVAVLGEHEDVANARLVFENGCVANLTASRLALKTERKLRVFSEVAYVSLDYQGRRGVVIRKSENAAALEQVREQIAGGADLSQLDYSQLVSVEELEMGEGETEGRGDAGALAGDPLTAELVEFVAAVREGRAPAVDGAAGAEAVEAAERVVEALKGHRWMGLEAHKV